MQNQFAALFMHDPLPVLRYFCDVCLLWPCLYLYSISFAFLRILFTKLRHMTPDTLSTCIKVPAMVIMNSFCCSYLNSGRIYTSCILNV